MKKKIKKASYGKSPTPRKKTRGKALRGKQAGGSSQNQRGMASGGGGRP